MIDNAYNEDEDFHYLESSFSDAEMYQGIADDALIYETDEGDGKHAIRKAEDHRQRLYRFDHFVQVVLKAKQPHFVWSTRRSGGTIAVGSKVTRAFYDLIFVLIDLLDDKVRYSENVELFLTCFRKLGLPLPFKQAPERSLSAFEGLALPDDPSITRCGDVYNRLLDLILAGANEETFKRRVRERKRSADENYRTGVAYVANLYAKKSRLLVLRIDLGYQAKLAKGMTAEQARGDLTRFLNNRRHNSLFETHEGYIWKLEDGQDRGLHFHLILFFDGQFVKKHACLAELIGKYWVESITKGQGTYFSCHRNPGQYRRSGIGMIHNTDVEKLATLNTILRYITKKEQYLRIKDGRTFGRGISVAVSSGAKIGRPRTKQLLSKVPPPAVQDAIIAAAEAGAS